MANPEHLEILQHGVEAWNQWREENRVNKRFVIPDLYGADLEGANLQGINLWGAHLFAARLDKANLKKATLFDASLFKARLTDADLNKANLGGANLSEAIFYRTNLTEAFLYGANLWETYFWEADLRGATLSNVSGFQAGFVRANLSGANLNHADLRSAEFNVADLTGVDLSCSELSGARFPLADLSGANLSQAILGETDFYKANLAGADLQFVILNETNLMQANLTGCRVYGATGWGFNLKGTIQKDLIVTKPDDPLVLVDDLELAQFVCQMLYNRKARDVFNALMANLVLLLGRYGGGGLKLLKTMGDRLRELDYVPIIFDFERPREEDYTEMVKPLIGMSRFVIIDLSGPSVPQEVNATVPHFNLPFVPIIEVGREKNSVLVRLLKYYKLVGLLKNQNILKPIEFESQEQLVDSLPEQIIAPAEALIAERQAKLAELH